MSSATPMPANLSQPAAASEDIVAYLGEFGLALAELTPAQTAMFLAARNVAGYVDDLVVPIATRNDATGEPLLVERETDRMLALTAPDAEPQGGRLPENDMDVTLLHNIEDLPRIFPSQWLIEDVQPDLFYLRAIEGELLVPEWQRPTQRPRDADEEMPERELTEAFARANATKQHAYLLLDTSRTMNDHDRRGTIARGLALAFLRKGQQQRARLHLRPFTAEVGDLSSGVGQESLAAIARRVVGLKNAGQTRIQTALEQAVADIRQEGPVRAADIMLISDGISKLRAKPHERERLHTFIVGDMFEDESTGGTVATLKSWSTTFTRLWKNRFAELLTPTSADLHAAGAVLESLVEQAAPDPHAAPPGLREVLENVKSLVKELKRSLGKGAALPDDLRDVEATIAAAEQLAAKVPPQATDDDSQGSHARATGKAVLAAGSDAGDSRRFALWQWLKALVVRLYRRLRG